MLTSRRTNDVEGVCQIAAEHLIRRNCPSYFRVLGNLRAKFVMEFSLTKEIVTRQAASEIPDWHKSTEVIVTSRMQHLGQAAFFVILRTMRQECFLQVLSNVPESIATPFRVLTGDSS